MLNELSTVRELLAEIRMQKEQLINEKKIRKAKPLPLVTDDEKPFELPSTWKWVRFGEILQIINGDRGKNYPSKKELHETGDIPFISALNINDNTISTEQLLYVDKKRYDILRSGKLKKGDLVLCIRGSLGKNCRYPFESGAIASSLVIIRSYLNVDFIYDYIAYYLNSWLFKEEMSQYDNGTAQPNLGARDLSLFAVPLPPLAEQQRIVAHIESLFSKLDAAREKVQSVLAAHETRKAALLHDALAGKLTVKWREENGESIPYPIKTLGDFVETQYGYTEKSSFDVEGPHYLRITDIQEGTVDWKYVPHCLIDKDDYEKYKLKNYDILVARTGATTGKSYMIREANDVNGVFASYLIRVQVNNKQLLPTFLYMFLQSQEYWSQIMDSNFAVTKTLIYF